jgi:predicted transcriptional regulator
VELEKRLGKSSVGEFLRAWRVSEELSQSEFAQLISRRSAVMCMP